MPITKGKLFIRKSNKTYKVSNTTFVVLAINRTPKQTLLINYNIRKYFD